MVQHVTVSSYNPKLVQSTILKRSESIHNNTKLSKNSRCKKYRDKLDEAGAELNRCKKYKGKPVH